MVSGGPTHVHISPIVAAGMPHINTFGTPGPVIGPPTCGMGGVPGVTIGQAWKSPMRAAGFDMVVDTTQTKVRFHRKAASLGAKAYLFPWRCV